MPSATRSVSSRRKITGRCVRSNVSSVAALCGNARKVLITTPPALRAMNEAGGHAARPLRRWNRGRREIPGAAAVSSRSETAGSGHAVFLPRVDPGEDRADHAFGTDESAVVQPNQTRLRVEHQDEKIIVIVLLDADRRGDTERFDEVRYGVAVTDDQGIAG